MLTLAQLLSSMSAEAYRRQLLTALQGVGYVTKTGRGSGAVLGTGVATNAFAVRAKITTAGNLGSAAMQVSTDGGATYGTAVAVPANGAYVVGATGLTLQFSNGPNGSGNAFEVGDLYALDLVVPVFPATSWQPGSVPLTLVEVDAEANEQRDAIIEAIASGGFLSTATGDWLTLLAYELYRVERRLATATVGTLVLTNSTGSAIALTPGQVWAGTIGGLRFSNTVAGTIPANGTLALEFRAEKTGSDYDIGAGGITTLFTALPGVTVNNPSASWVTSTGADDESDASLRARCVAKWPALTDAAGTRAVYESWARAASEAVTRVVVRPSPTVAGEVEVFLAGAVGGVQPTDVTDVDAYLQARIPYPSTVVVASATAEAVTITAVLYVRAGTSAASLAGAAAALDALAANTAIGATFYLSNIIEALSSPPGVRNVTLSAPLADVALDPTDVVVLTKNLSTVEVA